MDALEKARIEIDEIDEKMLRLFERRMEVSAEIGRIKKENGMPIRDEKREQDLLEKELGMLKDPAMEDSYVSFFSRLMSISRAWQEGSPAEGD